MRTTLKVILIIIAFIVTAGLMGISKAVSGSQTGSGPFGIILMVAFIAGARAIWKYNPDKNDNSSEIVGKNDNQQLDKS